MKKLLYILSLLLISCSNEYDGVIEIKLVPENVEIKAEGGNIQIQPQKEVYKVPLNDIYILESDNTKGWKKKSIYDCNKAWQNVGRDGYDITFSNPDSPSELIVIKGKELREMATICIPKNTTNKKRCFYFEFDDNTHYGYVIILQHEK